MLENILLILMIVLAALSATVFGALTNKGGIAAAFTGAFIVLGFGFKGFILLALFFVTSSFWSKYKKTKKEEAGKRNEKGDCRDHYQVLANGGIAALAGLLYSFNGESVWLFAFCVALASSNSDTWASEIGTLSRKPPFSIRTLSVAEPGTSGAISSLGTFAALMGASLIAAASFLLYSLPLKMVLLIMIFGFLGNAIDTILGAYFQAVNRCPRCRLETEKLFHCEQRTILMRGVSFLNNDAVNFLSGLLAVLLGIIFFLL